MNLQTYIQDTNTRRIEIMAYVSINNTQLEGNIWVNLVLLAT